MLKKMDPQTERGYWRSRSFYAKQLDDFHRGAYESIKKDLRERTFSPYFRWDVRPSAMHQADLEADKLAQRQWAKLECEFEGYEL